MKPELKNTIALLKDNQYFADLMNGPCRPTRGKAHSAQTEETEAQDAYIPVNPDWIDEEMSERLTKVYHGLIPGEMPFDTLIQVVRNSDVLMNGVAVDDGSKRTRYIVVTVVRDTGYPYDMNFPLIQSMGIVSLGAWELTRSAIAASEEFAKVLITDHPVPPILNNAFPEWVSLYVGSDGFKGPKNLRSMAIVDENTSDDLEMDTHLYEMRSIDDPLARRLLEAVDEDMKAHMSQEGE